MIRCLDISVAIDGQPIVDTVSFEVLPGQCLALLGPSGCGKTTILKSIVGELSLQRGAIQLGDADRPRPAVGYFASN